MKFICLSNILEMLKRQEQQFLFYHLHNYCNTTCINIIRIKIYVFMLLKVLNLKERSAGFPF